MANAVKPLVGIIMGSDSDLPVMKDAAKILDMFGVPHEVIFSFIITIASKRLLV